MALAIYVTLFSAVAPAASSAYAANTAYFSITLIAPTSNPVRRQYASIIANSMTNVGIDAKVFYVTFDELQTRLFFLAAYNPDGTVDWSKVGPDFADGGYDAGFIGWGPTSTAPDGSFSNFLGDYADWAPNGNNYYLYNNSVATSLMESVYKTTDVTQQEQLMYQLQSLIQNDTPQITIYYNLWVIARSAAFSNYGVANAYSNIGWPSDVQHYSGGSSLTFAESAGVFPNGNLNPLPTTQSNSFYSLFIYAPAFSGLQEIDARTNAYYLALANYINSTPDGKNWTINFKPNNFQDGIPVTSDDFVFTYESLFNPNGGYVGQGTMLSQLGTKGVFTYTNGTSITMDQTPKGQAPATWYVTAVNNYTFTINLPAVYAFMNTTWTTVSPLPKHFLEQYPITTWNSLPYCTAAKTYTSNGVTFQGPFSNGPYMITKFDFTSNTANEVAWDGWWNATGLKALGQYSVKNYNVVWINGQDAAIAALKAGTVQQLDTNYGLGAYIPQMKAISGVSVLQGADLGYQEMGFNLMNPVWGTGAGTPAGTAAAAADVRRAISYLVPRQLIITNLLAGLGSPGITPWGPAYGQWFNSALTPDPFDTSKATALLAAAGYSGGGPLTPVTPPPIVAQNYLVAGVPIEVSGQWVDSAGITYPNALTTLQASYDYDPTAKTGTWVNVATITSGANGTYAGWFTPTQPGTVFLRWNNWPLASSRTNPYSPVFNYTVLTLGDALTQALTPYAQSSQVSTLQQSLNAMQTSLQNSINNLSSKVTDLQSSSNNATYIGYGAIIVAIIALIVALLMARRKPQ